MAERIEKEKPPMRAIDIFNKDKPLNERIAAAVFGKRVANGWTRKELADFACAGDEEAIVALEDEMQMPAKDVLLACMDALKISLQNIMVGQPTVEQELYWAQVMQQRKVAALARATGPNTVSETESLTWALGLFLRMEALDELCPRPQVKASTRKSAEHYRAMLR